MYICAQIKCIKYWLKITQLPEDRYVKACYNDQLRQDRIGRRCWVTNVKEMLERYGFAEVWTMQGVSDVPVFINVLRQRMRDCYYQEWYLNIHDSSKI